MLTSSLAVASALQKEITLGRYPVGFALPTAQDIALRFGCGLVCAHVAIATLEAAGFVSLREGRAVVVGLEGSNQSSEGLGQESIQCIIRFLETVEPAAVALAALTVGDSDVRLLNALQIQMGDAYHRKDFIRVAEIAIHFHLAIAEMSGNDMVKDTLQRELPLVVFFHGSEQKMSEDILQSIEDHSAILGALRVRDAAAASAAMQGHLTHLAHRLGVSQSAANLRRSEAMPGSDRPALTERELDCLRWFAAGKTAWETGKILHISEWTVVYHLGKLKQKLGVSSKRQLVGRAIALGYIDN